MAGPKRKPRWYPTYSGARSDSSSTAGESDSLGSSVQGVVPSDDVASSVAHESTAMTTTTTTTTTTTNGAIDSKGVASYAVDQAPIEDRPQSKTALGRMTYFLKDLPKLYVVEVETKYAINAASPDGCSADAQTQWKSVQSRSLRYKALTKYFQGEQFALLRHLMAINTKASQYTDHIIIPIHAMSETQFEEMKALLRPGVQTLTATKKHVNPEGTIVDQDVCCNFAEGRTCSDHFLSKLYWQSLLVLIRKRATGVESASKYGIDHEFVEFFDQGQRMETVSVSIDDRSRNFRILLRNTPRINSQNRTLTLDFDVRLLVPTQDKRAHDVLQKPFGSESINKPTISDISAFKKILLGLHVRCAYAHHPNEAQRAVGAKAEFFDRIDSRGRRFQVRDIKLPEEVPSFSVNSQTYSVSSYFDDVNLPNGKKVAKQTNGSGLPLPLLHDGKGHWVPLDMVYIDDPAINSRFDYVTSNIKSRIITLLKTNNNDMHGLLQPVGKTFFDNVAKSHMETKPLLQAERTEFCSMDFFTVAFM